MTAAARIVARALAGAESGKKKRERAWGCGGKNMRERTVVLTEKMRGNPRNRLLAALPHEVLSSLRWHLRPVSLMRGTTLCEAEEPLRRVYFVEAGAVSMVTVFAEGLPPKWGRWAARAWSETIGLPFGTENCAAARDFLI